MRYYENPCGYPAGHHHGRPNIEIDVVPGWGGGYYQAPPPPRPAEVVYMSPAATYMPGTQVIMPQPYAGGVTVTSTPGYYPQQQQQQIYEYQQYQYQQQPYNPYSQW